MDIVKSTYQTALYMRLSKEDEGTTESSSILTQKKMLEAYANENGFDIYDEYIDDGYTGTSFERPAFKRMIRDIENGKVNMVITKDLSRLGREYITTGQYTEIFFPEHNVRYIAINDGYDSNNQCNDLAPFKNVINEMYARDISKKIKSSIKTKMKEGKYVANFAPYGYIKSPNDKNKLIPDLIASIIVKEIFSMASQGMKPKEIVDELNDRNIMPPSVYRCNANPKLDIDNYSKHKIWTSSTITKILKNIVYLGHTAQGKTDKLSIKSKTTIKNPTEDWIIVYNTHEPLIDKHTFDLVSQYRVTRKSKRDNSFNNIFSGIAKCGDCGKSMSTTISRKNKSSKNLVCGGYKLHGKKVCTNHFIDYDELYGIVLGEIKNKFKVLQTQEAYKSDIIKKLNQVYYDINGSKTYLLTNKINIGNIKKRIIEIDTIIKNIYEDNIFGRLDCDRFNILLAQYETEQNNLKSILETNNLNQKYEYLDNSEKNNFNTTNFDFEELVDSFFNINELTSEFVYAFIEKIEIYQGKYIKLEQGKAKKQQQIKIYYKCDF